MSENWACCCACRICSGVICWLDCGPTVEGMIYTHVSQRDKGVVYILYIYMYVYVQIASQTCPGRVPWRMRRCRRWRADQRRDWMARDGLDSVETCQHLASVDQFTYVSPLYCTLLSHWTGSFWDVLAVHWTDYSATDQSCDQVSVVTYRGSCDSPPRVYIGVSLSTDIAALHTGHVSRSDLSDSIHFLGGEMSLKFSKQFSMHHTWYMHDQLKKKWINFIFKLLIIEPITNQNKWPHGVNTGSDAVSRHILHSKNDSFVTGGVVGLLFSVGFVSEASISLSDIAMHVEKEYVL